MKLKNLISLILLYSSLSAFSQATIPNLLKNIPINVVAPASGADSKTLADLKNIKTLNLNIPIKCLSKGDLPFLASTDEIRFNCLKDTLYNANSELIRIK